MRALRGKGKQNHLAGLSGAVGHQRAQALPISRAFSRIMGRLSSLARYWPSPGGVSDSTGFSPLGARIYPVGSRLLLTRGSQEAYTCYTGGLQADYRGFTGGYGEVGQGEQGSWRGLAAGFRARQRVAAGRRWARAAVATRKALGTPRRFRYAEARFTGRACASAALKDARRGL